MNRNSTAPPVLGSISSPLVSILIRTCSRPGWLREALQSVLIQSYPNIEAVVVEDGPPVARKMVEEEFAERMNVQYYATQQKGGRARAGNIAMSLARGEWFNFLDDDDLLMPKHVEVLMRAINDQRAAGAYSVAWETSGTIISEDPLVYRETNRRIRHRQPFCRITLWQKNYLPIQSVLFHRRLYEEHGGFDEEMEVLEDWNLWTRYTLCDDFVFVNHSTSVYRLGDICNSYRQQQLDGNFEEALIRQEQMPFHSSPRAISGMVDDYIRSQALILVTRNQMKSMLLCLPFTKWLMARRQYFFFLWLRFFGRR
jgi:glycosyltransferase involved in cell wall biosynthesis